MLGKEQQHPTLGVGTHRAADYCPTGCLSIPSCLGNRIEWSRGIKEEITERGRTFQGPLLGAHFPGCSPCPVAALIILGAPMRPCSLHSFSLSQLMLLFHCHSPFLSPFHTSPFTISPPPNLCSHTFCGKHHHLLYFPWLSSSSLLPLQPQGILLSSAPCSLCSPPFPSDHLPCCQEVNKAHRAEPPFLFMQPQSATTPDTTLTAGPP